MRSRVLVVLGALTLSLLLPGTVGARNSTANAAKAESARIAAYWTPERRATAKSKDYVRDANSGKMVPAAKPGGGGGGVTGASWTGGGTINKWSGKLYFSTTAGNWQCSASVVNDGGANGYSIILTAGHCTYDGAEGWSTNVQFIPDFDYSPTSCATTHYGCWNGATRLAVNKTFYTEGGFGSDASANVDYGFMRLGPGGLSGNSELDTTLGGGYGFRTASPSLNDSQWAFGYPAAGKYKGKDLTYCSGTTIDDPYGVGTWGMACNMTGGSSGGPWLDGTTNPASSTQPGVLSSLNSYGYSGLTYMFGPKFNSATTTVKDDLRALNASSTTQFN